MTDPRSLPYKDEYSAVWSTSWSWSRLRVSYGSWRSSFSAGGTKLREAVLHRLMDAGQQLVPFRFIIYAGLAGIEMGPVM
jgi:hypothetical protein